MITAHRKPTTAEIRFGEGATHHKDFERDQWEYYLVNGRVKCADLESAKRMANRFLPSIVCIERKLRTWIVCPHDGLRYYR